MKAIPYDFRSPSPVPKEQTHTVRLIHDTYAQNLCNALSAFVNTDALVTLEQLEQLSFEEYLLSLSTPTCACTFDMAPLTGYGVLEINAPVAYLAVDKLLGGNGDIPDGTRHFTELELAIVQKLIKLLLKELGQAWSYVLKLNLTVKDLQTNPSFIRVISKREPCMVTTLKTKIGEVVGLITICLPYVNFEPIASKLEAEKWDNRLSSKQTEEILAAHERNFSAIELELSAILGEFQMSSTELLALQAGDILDTGHKTRDPIVLRVADEPKFLANPGLLGKYRGALIQNEIVKE